MVVDVVLDDVVVEVVVVDVVVVGDVVVGDVVVDVVLDGVVVVVDGVVDDGVVDGGEHVVFAPHFRRLFSFLDPLFMFKLLFSIVSQLLNFNYNIFRT